MSGQKQQKQQYLTERIIEANYDPDDFVDYCLKVSGNVDIDNWTMSNLQQIVKGYISSKRASQLAIHQTSFVDYQQDDQKPNFNFNTSSNQYGVTNKIQQNQKIQTSSTRINIKLQANEKDNLDKLFQDPFKNSFKKKQKEPTSMDWGYDSYPTYSRQIWGDKKKSDFDDNFYFDSPPIRPQKKKSVTTKKVQTNFYNPQTSNFNQEFTFDQIPSPKNIGRNNALQKEQKNFNNINNSQKSFNTISNINSSSSIFDIKFDDIKDISLSKKSVSYAGKSSKLPQNNNNQVEERKQPVNSSGDFDLLGASTNNNQKPIPGNTNDLKKSTKQQPRVVQQDWNDKVACIKAKVRTLANKPDLQVIVSGHQIIKKNLFIPDEVRYILKTPAINAEVKRKYNEFLKLRINLQKFYPGFRLPFLKKTGWIQQTDPGNIATQKSLISGFINDLLMNRQLKNCRIVEEFLTITDNKALKSKFQEYDRMAKLHSIEELCLIPGQVNVGYSDAHRVYLEKVPPFVHNLQIVLDRYKKQLESFVYTQQLLQKNIHDLFQTTSLLQSLTKGFNASVQMGQCFQLEATLRLIRKIYKQIDKQSKFQMNLFDVQLKPLFRYERDNIGTIKQQLQYKARFNQTFDPNVKFDRKEVYTNLNLDDYKIKIDEPSRSMTVLRYQHGYFANQAVMETKRLLSNFSKKLSMKFSQFCYTAQQRNLETINVWRQMKKSMALPLMA